jgi:hypothetical protein
MTKKQAIDKARKSVRAKNNFDGTYCVEYLGGESGPWYGYKRTYALATHLVRQEKINIARKHLGKIMVVLPLYAVGRWESFV